MDQREWEARLAAQKRALKALDEKPMVKAIDLVEMLLRENPSLPVVVQIGTHQFPIACVQLDDDENNIQIGI